MPRLVLLRSNFNATRKADGCEYETSGIAEVADQPSLSPLPILTPLRMSPFLPLTQLGSRAESDLGDRAYDLAHHPLDIARLIQEARSNPQPIIPAFVMKNDDRLSILAAHGPLPAAVAITSIDAILPKDLAMHVIGLYFEHVSSPLDVHRSVETAAERSTNILGLVYPALYSSP
jgi:hypothetical protein